MQLLSTWKAMNIAHGDVKLENLLLTRSGRVKIGDFSACHAFEDDNDELWSSGGTVEPLPSWHLNAALQCIKYLATNVA
ncbi:hypothetical protein SLEP1_g39406 [Rubroshorea leprosula]|uniref:Protein kinase domain-containing protein n=1 Tax=Rubroshorea leprosula TaxID=152421 RepID=A0AAV5L1A0_9ROSI|nr:hypothetical protein SLEP1_g39406 [Rubroshorea leprosula]